jgi:hypothetical protein
MVGKFGPSDVFTPTKKEEHELSYHLDVINESNNNETKAAIEFSHIVGTFQIELPTTSNCPPTSPMPRYYVEMANNFSTTINNHEKDHLVVDLEDVTLELKDLIDSNQIEEV